MMTPGDALFAAVRARLGPIPIIAEDLGKQTPQAIALRDKYNFPGMRILQFAFGDDDYNCPHVFPRNSVVYTGTHDNQTIVGWFNALKASHNGELARTMAYVGGSPAPSHWDFIRILFASVAQTVIVPVQDVLGLGAEHRMNVPGILHGNWGWRMSAPIPQNTLRCLRDLAEATGRYKPEETHAHVQPRHRKIARAKAQ
jgi:4-alpha-glucanotransferase